MEPGAPIDEDRVGRWLAAQLPSARPPFEFRQIQGGLSNLTFEVRDAASGRWVLRRPPTGPLPPRAHDVVREFHWIAAMRAARIPVAEPLGLCEDTAVTGSPFYVMSFVDGHVLEAPSDVPAALDAAGRQRAGDDMVDVLSRLHAVDTARAPVGRARREESYLARQLDRWHHQYRATQDRSGALALPDLDAVHATLLDRMPRQQATTVVHGDFRLENVVLSPEGTVRAVLDWELATIGDPLADLGVLLTCWAEPHDRETAMGTSPTLAPGFRTRDELASRYAEATGLDLSQLDVYRSFAHWKLACVFVGVHHRYSTGAMGAETTGAERFAELATSLARQARSYWP